MEYRECFLFEMMCDPPARLWSGAGSSPPIEGDTYLGGGELLEGLPEIQQLINGTAQRVEFTASGVDQETIRLALEDRASVNGALVKIGTIGLDDHNQIFGSPDWEWEGEADIVTVDRAGTDSGDVTRSVTLSVSSNDSSRSKLQLTFFTDADQRKRSATDSFFSHVGGITQGATRRFGGTS